MYCVNFGSAVFGECCIHRIPTLGSLLEYNGVNTSGVRFLLSVCHKVSGLACFLRWPAPLPLLVRSLGTRPIRVHGQRFPLASASFGSLLALLLAIPLKNFGAFECSPLSLH